MFRLKQALTVTFLSFASQSSGFVKPLLGIRTCKKSILEKPTPSPISFSTVSHKSEEKGTLLQTRNDNQDGQKNGFVENSVLERKKAAPKSSLSDPDTLSPISLEDQPGSNEAQKFDFLELVLWFPIILIFFMVNEWTGFIDEDTHRQLLLLSSPIIAFSMSVHLRNALSWTADMQSWDLLPRN